MIRLFETEEHANVYKKYRMQTPQFVIQKIIHYVEDELPRPHGLAVDVGCGSGQNTLCFAPYFEKVVGFDVSAAQVEAARHDVHLPGNVSFDVAPAEKLPLADGSVELVVGSFSFHWFDFPSFYREVDRVLVSNGVAAAVAHNKQTAVHPTKSAQLNELMDTFVRDYLSEEMHERNVLVFNGYRDLPLPYEEQVRHTRMPLREEKTVAHVVGAYSSWSSYQKLHQEKPAVMETALRHFQEQFLKIMDVTTPPEETPMTLQYDYCLAMCRKPNH